LLNIAKVAEAESKFRIHFQELCKIEIVIHDELKEYADGKKLKGNERVGWLGEIYGKLLLGGTLVADKEEHDIETESGAKVSVKARKGFSAGWQQTSAIPKILGTDCPTHLLFVHLNEDYSIDRIWLYKWSDLKNRFKPKTDRGEQRGYIFSVIERSDEPFIVYRG